MNTRARVIADGSPWAARRINPAASRDRCCAKTINSRTPAARRRLLIGVSRTTERITRKPMTLSSSRTGTPCLGKSRRTRHCYRWRSTVHYHRPSRIETGCAFSREFRHRAAEWIAAFAGRLAGRPGVGCTKLDRCGDEFAKVAGVAANQFGSSKLGEKRVCPPPWEVPQVASSSKPPLPNCAPTLRPLAWSPVGSSNRLPQNTAPRRSDGDRQRYLFPAERLAR
jgi:hypothetical protein